MNYAIIMMNNGSEININQNTKINGNNYYENCEWLKEKNYKSIDFEKFIYEAIYRENRELLLKNGILMKHKKDDLFIEMPKESGVFIERKYISTIEVYLKED